MVKVGIRSRDGKHRIVIIREGSLGSTQRPRGWKPGEPDSDPSWATVGAIITGHYCQLLGTHQLPAKILECCRLPVMNFPAWQLGISWLPRRVVMAAHVSGTTPGRLVSSVIRRLLAEDTGDLGAVLCRSGFLGLPDAPMT